MPTHLHAQPAAQAHGPSALLLQAYVQMSVEHGVVPAQRVYCPHKDCSALLIRPGPREEAALRGPSECPSCHRGFCLCCHSPGWHKVREGGGGVKVGGGGLGTAGTRKSKNCLGNCINVKSITLSHQLVSQLYKSSISRESFVPPRGAAALPLHSGRVATMCIWVVAWLHKGESISN